MHTSKQGAHRVVIYPDWCKGCGLCAAFCPGKVLVVGPEGKARVVREDACLGCGFCEPHCPDFAILVRPRLAGNGRPNGDADHGSAPASTDPQEQP
jgi:2-oxoglutarate ferredoxin oxidoreductase subunit delta